MEKANDQQETSSEQIHFQMLLKWCSLNSNHPYIVFSIGFSFHFFFLVLTIIFATTNSVQIFYVVFTDIPMNDQAYEPFQCYKAWSFVNDYWDLMGYDGSIRYKYGENREPPIFRFYYDAADGNILSPTNLLAIEEIHKKSVILFNNQSVCLGDCKAYHTLVYLFRQINKEDKWFVNLTKTIDTIMSNDKYKLFFLQEISTDFVKTNSKYVARSMISTFKISFLGSLALRPIIKGYKKIYNEYYSRLYFYMEYKYLLGELLLDQVYKDIYLAIGSIACVYIFTYIQTKSFFITFFEITSIFTTFCMANFVHTLIFRIKFFGIFHVLSIFIILGIGCDNLFVFYDRWKSLEFSNYSVALRLYSSYTGVGWSMFITSLTTALAFCILAWTKLLTVFSFGVFVTLLVIINYLSLLLYLPSVIIIHHHKFHNEFKPDKVFIFVTRFFKIYYYNFLNYKFVKYVILAIFGAITIVGIIFVSRLKVAEEFPAFFVTNYPYSHMEYLRNNYYEKKYVDDNIEILLLFGLLKLDYSTCAYWDYTCMGTFIYDGYFTIDSPEIQEEYKNICDMLRTADANLQAELSLYNDTKYHVNCLINNMDKYYLQRFPNKSFQIPWITSNFLELAPLALNFRAGPDFPYKFETALYYFLSDSKSYSTYGKIIIFKDNEKLARYRAVKYGNEPGYSLNFSGILVNITLYQQLSGFTEKKKIFNNWIKWTKNLKTKFHVMVCASPEELSFTGYFHWIHVQEMLINAAIAGVVSGLMVSCPIVLWATQNIYTFLIIMLGTCLSTLSVTSMISITGWDLGLLESVNLTIVVGMTIDYLVHMGLAYNSSEKEGKEERTKAMLENMGISILSGMATTFGSTFFLFFCKAKFLFQFGIFIFVTIFSAGIYSMIFLPCMFLTFGPRLNQGDFHCNFSHVLSYIKYQKKNDKLNVVDKM